jgi:methyl coenzyme M reductase beta subunit
MNEQNILEELLALLEANGVAIRSEPLGGSGGGLCLIKGRHIFFVDTQASSAVSAAMCADAVSKMVDVEQIYVKPQVRQFIEDNSNQTI